MFGVNSTPLLIEIEWKAGHNFDFVPHSGPGLGFVERPLRAEAAVEVWADH